MLTRDLYRSKERTRHPLKPLFSHFFLPTPETIARLDIRLRRAALYPAELWVLELVPAGQLPVALDIATEVKTQVNAKRIHHVCRQLAGLAFAITACLAPFTASAEADRASPTQGPAMWRIADEDTELLIFGSIHILPDNVTWQREAVVNAMQSADVVYFETSDRDPNSSSFIEFFRAGMAAPGESVHEVLTPDQYDLLETALSELGLNVETFKGQKPWFAALTIGVAAMERQGHSAENGVETWMEANIPDNRDVRSLEDGMEVANALSSMSLEAQVSMLLDGIEDAQVEDDETVEKSLAAWLAGQPELLFDTLVGDMSTDMAEAYDVMFAARNRNWADKFERLLEDETGRIFIVVGAGHLAGPDSVVKMMDVRGWDAERR